VLGWSGAVLACRSAHVEGRPGVPADNEASVSCSGLVFWRSIRTFLEEKDQLAVCVVLPAGWPEIYCCCEALIESHVSLDRESSQNL
jgi:hypothetical protein